MEKYKRSIKNSSPQYFSSKYRRIVTGTLLLLSLSFLGCAGGRRSNLTVTASPSAAADDLIYFADATGTTHALQAESGKQLWQYSLGEDLAKRQDNQAGDLRIDRLLVRPIRTPILLNKLFGIYHPQVGFLGK